MTKVALPLGQPAGLSAPSASMRRYLMRPARAIGFAKRIRWRLSKDQFEGVLDVPDGVRQRRLDAGDRGGDGDREERRMGQAVERPARTRSGPSIDGSTRAEHLRTAS
jgi:hypothetical protein